MKSYFIYIHSLANKETDINDFLLQQNMINKSRLFINAFLCSYMMMSDDSMKLWMCITAKRMQYQPSGGGLVVSTWSKSCPIGLGHRSISLKREIIRFILFGYMYMSGTFHKN